MSKKPKVVIETNSRDEDFENALLTQEEIEEDIAIYEKMHGFSSETLLQMEVEGRLPDGSEFHAWRSLLKHRKPKVKT